MNCYIEQDNGMYIVKSYTPECGEDFCSICGDCLHCYGGYCDPYNWSISKEEREDFIKRIEEE